eukprot:tig00021179_g19251.t1
MEEFAFAKGALGGPQGSLNPGLVVMPDPSFPFRISFLESMLPPAAAFDASAALHEVPSPPLLSVDLAACGTVFDAEEVSEDDVDRQFPRTPLSAPDLRALQHLYLRSCNDIAAGGADFSWLPPQLFEAPFPTSAEAPNMDRPGAFTRAARAQSCPSPPSRPPKPTAASAPCSPALRAQASPAITISESGVGPGGFASLVGLPMPSLRPMPRPGAVARGASSYSAPTSPMYSLTGRSPTSAGHLTPPGHGHAGPVSISVPASPESARNVMGLGAPNLPPLGHRRPSMSRSCSAPSLGQMAAPPARGPGFGASFSGRANAHGRAPAIDEDCELDCRADFALGPPASVKQEEDEAGAGAEQAEEEEEEGPREAWRAGSGPSSSPRSLSAPATPHLGGAAPELYPLPDNCLRYTDGTLWSRSEALRRYREKRHRRNFHRGVTYQVRKVAAAKRLRVSGRFVPKGQEEAFLARLAQQRAAKAAAAAGPAKHAPRRPAPAGAFELPGAAAVTQEPVASASG